MKTKWQRFKDFWFGEVDFYLQKNTYDCETEKMIATGFNLSICRFNRSICYGKLDFQAVEKLVKRIILNPNKRFYLRVEQGEGWFNDGMLSRRHRRQILAKWAAPKTFMEEVKESRSDK